MDSMSVLSNFFVYCKNSIRVCVIILSYLRTFEIRYMEGQRKFHIHPHAVVIHFHPACYDAVRSSISVVANFSKMTENSSGNLFQYQAWLFYRPFLRE